MDGQTDGQTEINYWQTPSSTVLIRTGLAETLLSNSFLSFSFSFFKKSEWLLVLHDQRAASWPLFLTLLYNALPGK